MNTRILLTATLIMLVAGCGQQKIKLSYGATVKGDETTFRLHAPRATEAYVVLFARHDDETGNEYLMESGANGDWELTLEDAGYGTLYGYRVAGGGSAHTFPDSVIVADPYSTAAVTQNRYRHTAKSLIIRNDFDWEGDTWMELDPRDAVICELHVRDMTAHPSSGTQAPGAYLGMIEADRRGGITHIKDMGYNAVELLPAMDFGNVEAPFKDETAPVYNDWNPYARNHWGYMTTFFFTPETYYASDGTQQVDAWNGTDGRAVREFKEMVKALHREGIAVIMDVVYNHVSQYDYHPLKQLDRDTYFRLDDEGEFRSVSGCGNDTRSESAAMGRLILESVRYWQEEFHIDGFRFDLAYLIDKQTNRQIIAQAREVNPHAIIIAEPWGGGYDPNGFSDIGWAAWNDQFRNGIKGQNPVDGQGFIFGQWQGDNDAASLRRYVMGSLRQDGGQYLDAAHSVNYLAAHDDHTLGDFVRIGLGLVKEDAIIADVNGYAAVRDRQLAVNRLAAMSLLTSQGPVMIHAGQSWARGKVIAPTEAPDTHVGRIDHNSYEKDNATNWLNWDHKELNSELVDYYRGLVAMRQAIPALRHSPATDFTFMDTGAKAAIAYTLADSVAVLLNGQADEPLQIILPDGEWEVLADGLGIYNAGYRIVSGAVAVPPANGWVLRRVGH
ncbi:MAG: pullulanase [Candidatus Marinimicrobia bacterium]|nr:pullulanase [Candidatus Neomarinimicrobiota bacterium]